MGLRNFRSIKHTAEVILYFREPRGIHWILLRDIVREIPGLEAGIPIRGTIEQVHPGL